MAARNRKGLSENTRKRIQTTMIVKRLEKHIDGEVEMTSTQVTAALGLLRKTLPDLSAVEHSGEIATNNAKELTESEILTRIEELSGTGTSDGITEKEEGSTITH